MPGSEEDGGALMSLLQLASAALPVGSFAYSQGLELAVERGWIRDESEAFDWILGLLVRTQARQDIPIFARLHAAWEAGDLTRVRHWDALAIALRDSAEARAEERDTGVSLARLLAALGADRACQADGGGYLSMYARAAVSWGIPLRPAAYGWAWSWCQQQVAAAVRLVPLGQSAGQRILQGATRLIPHAVGQALALGDDDIGCSAAGLSVACAQHEVQYTRLFLS